MGYKNIKIIKTGLNVSKILKQLDQYKSDWGSQRNLPGTQMLDPVKHTTTVDVLQLIMGGITKPDEYVGNTEICVKTDAYFRHTEIVGFVKRYFKDLGRCGFLALPVGMNVGTHIDEGTYYLTKDRYHLSIQGRYEYTVENEVVIIEPGTLFCFNNKVPHSSKNIGDNVRISFIFDIPYVKNKSKYF